MVQQVLYGTRGARINPCSIPGLIPGARFHPSQISGRKMLSCVFFDIAVHVLLAVSIKYQNISNNISGGKQ